MKKKILFRVDYNKKIGLGHIFRCLNLALLLKKYKHEVTFLVKKEKKVNLIKNKKIKFIFLKKNISFKDEANLILKLFKRDNYDFLILDIDNFLTDKLKYEKFLEKIKNILNKTICWDNIVSNKFKFALTYRPYPNYLNLKKIKRDQKILSGLENFYYPFVKEKKKDGYRNILISLGGTVQTKILKKIILNINLIKMEHKLNIKILNFGKKKNIKKTRHDNFSTITKPIINSRIYDNIDIAIISGGMSKYECMLNSIPSIIINLNKQQSWINKNLNVKKLSLVVDNINLFYKKLNILLSNKSLRTEIRNNCYKIRKKFDEKKLINSLLNS